jgi:hypothetical protein
VKRWSVGALAHDLALVLALSQSGESKSKSKKQGIGPAQIFPRKDRFNEVGISIAAGL